MDLLAIATVGWILAVLAAAATLFGVDSRDESSDPHRSAYPVGLG